MTTAVLDLGVGNTASMLFALERLGERPRLTADPEALAEADRIVFPGVGSAGFAADRLAALGLRETLRAFPRPLLGVCLGMQMLYEHSEEGAAEGLGLIPGDVRRLTSAPDRPVPHMGWNRLKAERAEDPLLDGVGSDSFVYFVHGYAAPVGEETVSSAEYGEPFSAVVRRGNVAGCQFHPERSGATGARILKNFLDLPC
jgi:imidazole glycerol-phosphate synthase subunit HisH